MKKTGWMIGTIALAAIFAVFCALSVVQISRERIAVSELDSGDIAAVSNSGAGLRISVLEDIDAPEIGIHKTPVPTLSYDASVTAYDFTAGGKTSFNTLLEIRIPYDASAVASGENPADCVVAGYYNEATGELEPVIYDIDEVSSQVIITTDHLSTYTAVAFHDKQTRDVQCAGYPQPGTLTDVVPAGALEAYQKSLLQVQNGTPVSDFNSFEVGFNSTVIDLGIYGSATAVLHEAVYTNDYIAKLNNGFSNTGIAYIFAQLAVDIIKGDTQQLNFNLMKNLTNYGGTLINPLVGAASFSFDYTLGKVGKLKTDLDKRYYEEYEEFYEEYESDQEETNGSFSKRMFQSLYNIYNEYKKTGKTMTVEMLQSAVTKRVSDYCNIIWDQDMADTFSDYAEHGMTDALQKQITDTAYNNLLENRMPAVFAALQKRIVYDAKMEALRAQQALSKELNTLCTVSIREVQNFEGADYKYAGCIIQFDANPVCIDDWTFHLDDNGRALGYFRVVDYLNAHMPTAAYIYASEADQAAGNAMETVLCTFDSNHYSIDISLGSSEEYELQTSNTQIHVGDSVIFSVKPFADGYTCVWNMTSETTGYVRIPFSEPGVHTVTADVYDANGKQVAALSADVLVEAVGLRIISSIASPKANETFTFEVISDEVAASTLYTEWDFGDGNTYAGYYNLYDYWYEQPGKYTVTVNAYQYTDSEEKVFVATAQTELIVSGEGPAASTSPEPAETAGTAPTAGTEVTPDTGMPVLVGRFVLTMPASNGTYDEVIEFSGDGIYKHYYVRNENDISDYYEGTYVYQKAGEHSDYLYYITTSYGAAYKVYPGDISANEVVSLFNGQEKKQ